MAALALLGCSLLRAANALQQAPSCWAFLVSYMPLATRQQATSLYAGFPKRGSPWKPRPRDGISSGWLIAAPKAKRV